MISLAVFLFVAFLMLYLGGVVLVHDPQDRVNRLFFLWVVFAVVWMAANYLENVAQLPLGARGFFLRLDFASAVVAVGFLLLFVANFIDRSITKRQLAIYFLPAALLAPLSFSPWLLARVYLGGAGEIQYIEGLVFFFYAPAVICYFTFPCVALLRARRRANPALKAQMTSIAAGLIATTAVSLTVNLFFQNVLSVDWFRIGIYAVLFFVIGTAWAIVRHEFLKIRFVVMEILLLGVLATMLTRTILSADGGEAAVNGVSLVILLILGFAMIRSFLNEERRRQEIQHLATELAVSNKRLRQLDDLKTTMVSIASHQIRGPLGGIRGYLTMFRDGDLGAINDKQKEIVTLNLNVTTRLLNAVETFLDITKLESGALTLRKEVLPLDDAVKDVVDEFLLPAAKKGIALSLKFDCPRPIWVEFDPEKIKHVIFNLIDNALKYTEKGSIAVGVRCDGHDAIFEVSDTGMGIKPEDAPRLFGKYQRGELVIDRGGSGLGLYVVKMLTEMQGGRIWAASPGLGKGSTFGFALPISRHL
ncbi:MAG TPA: ATP-binding protein [Candidatus Baltobacteraceae bacterium]|nr:ATP-binding protein [Candidatus Baltobacteraceae bacterium]